jgi:hypothetical protein
MPVDKELDSPTTETDGEGSVEQETQGQSAGQAAAAPGADVNELQATLKREREQRIEQSRSYDELRSKFNSRDHEIARLRSENARLSNAGQGEENVESGHVVPGLAREVAATREQLAWMQFRQDHPKYSEFWDEMQELAKNPVYRRTIQSYRVNEATGQVELDTFATLHNTYNEVALRRVNKAQTTTAERKAASVATNKQIRAQATISGEGAGSDDSGAADYGIPYEELMSMEYEQIIKDPRFKRHIDPNDPPRGI